MLSKTEANRLSEANCNNKFLDDAIHHNETQEALAEEDFNTLLFEATREQNIEKIIDLINRVIQNNKSIDLKNLKAAISQADPKMIQHIIPHCGFSKPSDQYIPRELVIESGPNHEECIELLLKWNFTVNPDSKEDVEFVYAAVEKNYLPIVSQLLNFGVNVNMVNSQTGLNLLTIACLLRHHEMVENLLKHKANVNVITPGKNSRLNEQLIVYSKLREFTKFISLGYKCGNDLLNVTCLHIAVFNSDPIMTELLLKYGAKIISDPKFFNIAYFAITNEHEDIFCIFLNYGVNVTDTNLREKTFLHSCVFFHSEKSSISLFLSRDTKKDSRYNRAKWLLENGANKLLQTPRNSLVFEAIGNGHYKTAQLFLDYNPDVQYVSEDDDTVLHKAIEHNFDLTFITKLFNLKCPVHIVNSDGFTPFFLACRKSPFPSKIIKKLLQYYVDVDCADNNLMTPLHFACNFYDDQCLEVIRLLLHKEANPNAKNDKGQTPFHYACSHFNSYTVTSLIELFLTFDVNLEATDSEGWTPLFIARRRNNCEAVRVFSNTNANVNHSDSENSTPLHVAVKKGSYNVTSCLIEYGGANIDALDNNNRTPLQIVQERLLYFQNRRNSCYDKYDTYRRIAEILVRHAVKLKVAGLEVNQNFTYTNDRGRAIVVFVKNSTFIEQQYRASYEEEIKKMKMENIGTTGITFYDLLTRNFGSRIRFCGNEIILEALKNKTYDNKFPSYINIVRNRFREVMVLYKAMNSIREYFRENVCEKLPDECIESIFSYLSFEDLFTFVGSEILSNN